MGAPDRRERVVMRHRRIPVIRRPELTYLAPATPVGSASCVRDLTPSLRKALRRWYSTVLALINRRAAISRFVSSLRGKAGDLCLLWSELVQSRHGSLAGTLARRLQLEPRALGERLDSGVSEELVGGSQLLPSI